MKEVFLARTMWIWMCYVHATVLTLALITLQYLPPGTIMTNGTVSSVYVLPEGR